MGRIAAAVMLVGLVADLAQAQTPKGALELNTALMEATFRIQGQSVSGPSTGTGFILVIPYPDVPGQGRIVLITAAHVLNSMVGDSASLMMRRKLSSGWQNVPIPIQIRTNGHTMWVQHSRADVAALYVSLPDELKPSSFIPTSLLIGDKDLSALEIHPGDELNVLGYPLGYGNVGDFPVLRSGKIASYPLVPTGENPFFLLDFRVFQGNSGGPVYFVQANRNFQGGTHIGVVQFVMGLVSEEVSATEQFHGLYENRSETYPLGLAKIVPASYITETLSLLPTPK